MTSPASPPVYRPIAVGFLLLAAPLAVAIFLAENAAGAWANAAAAMVLAALGVLLWRKTG